MLEIQKKRLYDCIKLLKALQVDFAIVTEEETFGNLEVVKPKTGRSMRPDLWKAYDLFSLINQMNSGDCVSIVNPNRGASLIEFQSAMSYRCKSLWGKGNYTTYINDKTEELEVMRIV